MKEWKKEDFISIAGYAIYHHNAYPNIKIHYAKVGTHRNNQFGYPYAVYRSGYPCATFIGGSSTLKKAIEIAKKEV